MWAGLALGLAAMAAGLAAHSDEAEQWGAAARLTARAGFALLLLAYIARPLHQLRATPFSKALLAKRKWIGLGFAMSHSVHLLALSVAMELSGRPWDAITVIFGGGAYAILYAMAFTSNARAMRAMGVWWKRLHRAGIHYLWFIFLQAYAGRIFEPDGRLLGVICTALALLAAGLRLAAWTQRRRQRSAARV